MVAINLYMASRDPQFPDILLVLSIFLRCSAPRRSGDRATLGSSLNFWMAVPVGEVFSPKSTDITADVDGFATNGNRQFKRYWYGHKNAFDQDWSRDILWINAPWSKMQEVVLKAVMDQA